MEHIKNDLDQHHAENKPLIFEFSRDSLLAYHIWDNLKRIDPWFTNKHEGWKLSLNLWLEPYEAKFFMRYGSMVYLEFSTLEKLFEFELKFTSMKYE